MRRTVQLLLAVTPVVAIALAGAGLVRAAGALLVGGGIGIFATVGMALAMARLGVSGQTEAADVETRATLQPPPRGREAEKVLARTSDAGRKASLATSRPEAADNGEVARARAAGEREQPHERSDAGPADRGTPRASAPAAPACAAAGPHDRHGLGAPSKKPGRGKKRRRNKAARKEAARQGASPRQNVSHPEPPLVRADATPAGRDDRSPGAGAVVEVPPAQVLVAPDDGKTAAPAIASVENLTALFVASAAHDAVRDAEPTAGGAAPLDDFAAHELAFFAEGEALALREHDAGPV